MTNEWEQKKMIIEIGRRIWQRGYVAANDGNITVRLSDKEILTTSTGVSKGFMSQEMIIKMNMDGEVINPGSKYKPSSEVKMHLEIYRQRDDIHAVIHTHPPYCTSFAVAGIPLDKCVLPEAVITLGAVPIAPYGTPSTMEIPDSIKNLIQTSDAVLLANHGALTLGIDLVTAYHRTETLEHTALITFLAIQLGNVNMIRGAEVDKLMSLRERLNIPGRVQSCAVPEKDKTAVTEKQVEEITRKVLEKIRKP